MRPDRGVPRLARTVVFATAALGLAAGGHSAGGGGLPHPVVFLLIAPPILLLSLWLSARRRSTGVLFGVLTLVQVTLHVVFHAAHQGHLPAGSGLPHAPRARPHLPSHGYDGAGLLPGLLPSPAMLLCHVVAIAVTGWVMARGERTLWRVAHRLRIRLYPQVPSLSVLPKRTPVDTDLRLLASRCAGRIVATRGPPVAALG